MPLEQPTALPSTQQMGSVQIKKNVAAIFSELKDELERHHDRHQLGSRRNRRYPNLELITKKVPFDHSPT
jgi:hypothetical protein